MPILHEWTLIDGLNAYYEAQRGDSDGSHEPQDDRDYRFPMASKGDVMASPEELMGFGIQYERLDN
jgi:hypothetical protein